MGGILVTVLVGFVMVVVLDVRQQAGSEPPEGVREFAVPSRNHVEGPVNYPQTPSVGGPHNPVWQNCGFYSEPILDENAAHSLEHGAVWIAYQPDLSPNQVEKLKELASGQTYVLASPYPDLPAAVVASAWGKQLGLDSADDPDLERFVGAYQQGPQTPEPGAACTGGLGEPQS